MTYWNRFVIDVEVLVCFYCPYSGIQAVSRIVWLCCCTNRLPQAVRRTELVLLFVFQLCINWQRLLR